MFTFLSFNRLPRSYIWRHRKSRSAVSDNVSAESQCPSSCDRRSRPRLIAVGQLDERNDSQLLIAGPMRRHIASDRRYMARTHVAVKVMYDPIIAGQLRRSAQRGSANHCWLSSDVHMSLPTPCSLGLNSQGQSLKIARRRSNFVAVCLSLVYWWPVVHRTQNTQPSPRGLDTIRKSQFSIK